MKADQYDGSKLFNWSVIFEMMEQRSMANYKFSKEAWDKAKLMLKDLAIVGKAMIVSTVENDEPKTRYVNPEEYHKTNGMYLLFKSGYWDVDDEGYPIHKPTDFNRECELLNDYLGYVVDLRIQNAIAYPGPVQRMIDYKRFGILYHFENEIIKQPTTFEEWKQYKGY